MSASLVPYDWQACQTLPNWREGLKWPTTLWDLNSAYAGVIDRLLALLKDCQEDDQAVLLLVAPILIKRALYTLETALNLDRAAGKGVEFVGGPAEVDFFRGKVGLADVPVAGLFPAALPRSNAYRNLAKSAVVTARLLGIRALLALAAPQAVFTNRSPMLDRFVTRSRQRALYRPPEQFLDDLPQIDGVSVASSKLSDSVAQAVVDAQPLSVTMAAPLRARMAAEAAYLVSLARAHLRHLAAKRAVLPRVLLTGSGGSYASRLLGLAVRANGGRTIRFGHAGLAYLNLNRPGAFAFVELAGCDEFWVTTPEARQVAIDLRAPEYLPKSLRPDIRAGDGDPSFALARGTRKSGQRRTVMYVPTLLHGQQQYLIPDLPDPVHLDWQLRLATMIQSMPVDLICKPYVGGAIGKQPNPLATVSRVSYARFEEVIHEADVLVFDIPSTTTFWKAMTTDKPIVLVNVSPSSFSPGIAAMLEERCAVLPVQYDAANLPQVEYNALYQAICSAPERADPSKALRFFAGAAAGTNGQNHSTGR